MSLLYIACDLELGHKLRSWYSNCCPWSLAHRRQQHKHPACTFTGTLSGTAAVAPEWISQQTETNSVAKPPVVPTNRAPSRDTGKQEGPTDLLLLASGHPVQAIRELKFVDLHDLLPEALHESQFFKTRESKDKKEKKKKFTIGTPLDWAVAFATYTGVAVHCKPEWAFELAAYASIVMNLARDVKGTA